MRTSIWPLWFAFCLFSPVVASAHGVHGVQMQAGAGGRTLLDGGLSKARFDGAEIWANASLDGLTVELGALYRHQRPTRGGAIRGGFGLRPLALAAENGGSAWRWFDVPVQIGLIAGAVEGPKPRLAFFTEVGVDLALFAARAHPAATCRVRWVPIETPTTEAPVFWCGLALRLAD